METIEADVRLTAALHVEEIRRVLEDKWELIRNPSYETGLLGVALYYSYYGLYTGDTSFAGRAGEFFSLGIGALDLTNFRRIYKTDSLDSHLAHIGRYIAFCGKHGLLELDAGDYLLNIDTILSDLMKSKIAMGNFDLNCGAMAAGYYFLSRPGEQDGIRQQLSLLVEGIERMAQRDGDGDYYWELPVLSNRVYLGISHGSALLISFLANVCERGIGEERCRDVMYKAIRFLLKQKHRYEKGLFPHYAGENENDRKQFSLCYGDIGVGYALFRAGRVLGDDAVGQEAALVLEECLSYSREDRLTLDAGINYGAAGLAAAFEKLAGIGGDGRYMERAEYWYGQIPAYAVHDNGFAGYKTRLVNAGDLWNINFGWGVAGIGISLMRYLQRVLPPIDALLSIA